MVQCLKAEAVAFVLDSTSVGALLVGLLAWRVHPLLGPVGIFVTHGGGGKAVESVKSICRTFKFRLACAPVLVENRPDEAAAERLREMGALLGKLAVEK